MSLVPLERSSPGSKDLPRKNVKVTVEEEEFNKVGILGLLALTLILIIVHQPGRV